MVKVMEPTMGTSVKRPKKKMRESVGRGNEMIKSIIIDIQKLVCS
jgi:hypothetical protein